MPVERCGFERRAGALEERLTRLLALDDWKGTPPPKALAHREACAAESERAQGTAVAAHWSEVAQGWAALGLPLEEAYARLREAECRVLEVDRDGAAEALAAGLALATTSGATWLRDQLEALARRARLAPAADARRDVVATNGVAERLGLTEREHAVLELLAQGMTNREIGEQLFIATKTARVHVSRILAKLDVSSRVEAATAAQRLGLVP